MDIQQILNLGIEKDLATKIYNLFISEIQKLNNEILKTKIDSIITSKLLISGARNITATKSLLDFTNLQFKDGDLIGLDEQITSLKSNVDTKFLFKQEFEEDAKGHTFKGVSPIESFLTPDTKNVSQMSYSELCNYYNN